MFNKKKSRKEGTRSGKRPDEVIRIGDSGLEIALWIKRGVFGPSVHWRPSRTVSERTYTTLRPEDLLALPEALRLLANGFSNLSDLPLAIRSQMVVLAEYLDPVIRALEESRGQKSSGTNGALSGVSF